MLDEIDLSKKSNYTARSQGLNYTSPWEAIKSAIINFLETFFQPKFDLKTKIFTQFVIEICTNSINCLQIISLLWYYDMNISGWNNYLDFWRFIGFFSFDSIIAELKVMKIAFYVISATLGFCIFLLLAIGALKTRGWKITNFIVFLPSEIIGFMTSIGFVPFMMVFLIVTKYSIKNDRTVIEYKPLIADDLDLGLSGAILGIFSAVFLFLFTLIYELFTADIRHSFADKNIKARSDSNLDVAITCFKTLIVILYIFAGHLNVYWYLTFFTISTVTLSYLTFKFNSYYNPIVNSIKVSKLFIMSVVALSFLFGLASDNALVTLVLCVCAIPLIFGIFLMKIWKITVNEENFSGFANDQHEFELKLRRFLMDKSQLSAKIAIDAFINVKKYPRFRVNKLFIAWKVNYCAFTIKDYCLSRINLAEMGNVSGSIEGEIQEWRIKKYLDDNKDKTPVLRFLLYLIDLEVSRHHDEHLCSLLIDLWGEVTSSKPRLQRLELLMRDSSDLIFKVKNLYNSMIDIKSERVFELYGSLLQTILREYEKGTAILSKIRKNKQLEIFMKNERKLSQFEEQNGNILISANKDNFGSIVFINDIGSQILKGRIFEIMGNKISCYIPQPYSKKHVEYEKKFIENCTNPQVEKPNSLFLLDQQGFLLECQILLRLTAMNNYLYFMMSFMTVKTSREIALTSEDGLIFSYSEGFAKLIAEPTKSIRNQYLSDFLPEIVLPQVPLFEPILLSIKENNVAFVHGVRRFKSTDMHFVLLITNPKEIDNWLEINDILQLEYFEKGDSFTELEHFESVHSEKSFSEKEKVRFNFKNLTRVGSHDLSTEISIVKFRSSENHKERWTSEEKSITISSSHYTHDSSSTEKKAHGKTIVKKSEMILKKFKLILFVSVLVVITTNVAIAIYISNAVNHSRSIDTFSDLGNILFNLVHIAENAWKIDFCIDSPEQQQYIELVLAPIKASLSELDASHNGILSNLPAWSYCDSSSIVVENLISIWNFDNSPKIVKTNLYDALQDIISNTKTIIANAEKLIHSPKEIDFIIINGVGNLYTATNNTLNGLVRCEIDMIYTISEMISMLFIASAIILGVCFSVLAMFIFIISRKYNALWQFIKHLTHLSYHDLRSACLDRLSVVHGIDYNTEDQDAYNRSKNTLISLKFNISKRYLMRLGIFTVFTIIYFFTVNFGLYPKCEDYLITRPNLLRNYLHRRALIPLIDFWTCEAILSNINVSTIGKTGNMTFFKNPHQEAKVAISAFNNANRQLIDNMSFMSDELLAKLFETGNIAISKNLQYGSYWYTNILLQDSEIYIDDYDIRAFYKLTAFGSGIQILEQAMTSNFELIDGSSQDLIIGQLNYIIYAIVAYSLISVFLFFLYYLPYINSEVKNLLKIQDIMYLIPGSVKNSKA
ncbi:unnamed protein product [Blepharisma stoltei]|uniref:PAS domain-containing protein n=1 Tax=Blepharisma stoltei TaxID=1481888 RepID=A0AAU9JC76_9CILI|nr:unnamed protein product [Blepharisma stoltei]